MNASLIAIILVSLVIPASDAASPASKNYQVSEVVRVLGPDSFECKLSNYKSPFIRFRVLLPGYREKNTGEESKNVLAERLKSAQKIELRNVTFGSYFRIEADLWLDDEPFWQRPAPKTPPAEEEDKKPANVSPQRPPQSEPPTERTAPVKKRRITIRDLLETQVDCSMLTDETPLSEALTTLSESVQPHLPLVILWKDLEANAFIEKDTPIGVGGLDKLTLRQALSIILRSVSLNGPDLALITEGKVLTLGTAETLSKNKTKVYPIPDLSTPPSTDGSGNRRRGNQGGNSSNRTGNGNRGGYSSR